VGFRAYNPSIPSDVTTLAEHLQTAGYYTAGFATTYCVKPQLGVSQGFDYYDDVLTAKTAADKARAGQVNQRVLAWLQDRWSSQAGQKPLFLFIYYFDPHVWYDPLPPYDTLYDDSYTGTLTSEVFGIGDDVVFGRLVPSPRDIEHVIALYDGEISYWDHYLGQLLSSLEDMGLFENTLLVVTADHGEMFGEHGIWTHGGALYEEMVRVPLLVRYSGVIPPGSRIATPVQSMDLMPTILDWAGLDLAGLTGLGGLQAVSLRPLLTGLSAMPERLIYSEVDSLTDEDHPLYHAAPRLPMIAIRQGDWKLIHYPGHPELDELYLLGAGSPYETTNLIAAEPERAGELLEGLPAWYVAP
jgi:arylsulfatase A-like enzyme